MFASVPDVMRGWLDLDEDRQADAATLIAAAEAWILERKPDIDAENPIAKRVVVEVVRAALAPPAEFTGHTSWSDAMGPWSQSGSVPTPAGTLHFTREQAAKLGITDDPMPVGNFGDPLGYRYPPPGSVMP